MIETLVRHVRRASRRVRGAPKSAAGRVQVYSIGMYGGDSLTTLAPLADVSNPVIAREQITDVPASLVADPFMIRDGERWHMFFEVFNDRSGKGEIGLASSTDGRRWAYQHIVLSEPFHLSYPYVFRWRDTVYMIPETYKADAVRLYRAVAFPSSWVFEQTLISGGEFVDSSPFVFDGNWWLLTAGGLPPMRADMLRLYRAAELTGSWTEHPQSPIYTNNRKTSRPAGRVVISDGRIFRYAQQCEPEYGTLVRAFEIVELTAASYGERPLTDGPVLAGSGRGWNALGMHHVDAHRLDDGRWLACVDGWRWESAVRRTRSS